MQISQLEIESIYCTTPTLLVLHINAHINFYFTSYNSSSKFFKIVFLNFFYVKIQNESLTDFSHSEFFIQLQYIAAIPQREQNWNSSTGKLPNYGEQLWAFIKE